MVLVGGTSGSKPRGPVGGLMLDLVVALLARRCGCLRDGHLGSLLIGLVGGLAKRNGNPTANIVIVPKATMS